MSLSHLPGCVLAAMLLLVLGISARAADFSIAQADAYDTPQHQRIVDLTIAAAPGLKVDRGQFSITTLFYARARDGSVSPAFPVSKVSWLTTPVDWASKTEGLEVEWPSADRSADNAPLGVVIGLYYRRTLQATWAFPAQLAKDFPLPAREELPAR